LTLRESLLKLRVFEKSDKHEFLLETMPRRGDKWQKDLKRVYGFAEMEACECFGIAV
jgi:hypothetical protein